MSDVITDAIAALEGEIEDLKAEVDMRAADTLQMQEERDLARMQTAFDRPRLRELEGWLKCIADIDMVPLTHEITAQAIIIAARSVLPKGGRKPVEEQGYKLAVCCDAVMACPEHTMIPCEDCGKAHPLGKHVESEDT